MIALADAKPLLAALREQALVLWERAVEIWVAGGWGMLAIAINAIVLFGLGVHVWRRLRGKAFLAVKEERWRRWVDHASLREGPIGELLDEVGECRSIEESAVIFQGLRAAEIAPFERDLRVMKICVGVAPLLGLFGTVTGMLTTFGALASGSGGEKTMSAIARGISEALITTETGLVVALPGLFFQYSLSRLLDRYRAFLAHVETVCTQSLHRRLQRGTEAA